MKEKIKRLFAPVAEYYRELRPSTIRQKRYRHILLLLYWAVYGLMFLGVERIFPLFFDIHYTAVWCPLDELIPFCEWFVFPYYFWFVFLIVPGLIWFLWEPDAFRHFMWSVMITYTIGVIIFLVFPNKQELRPMEFTRDNFMVDIVRNLYNFDTNTNVCPSIHVLGSVAAMFGLLDCRRLQKPWFKFAVVIAALLICASTVFMKQHSVLDVIAAVPLCLLGHYLCYHRAEAPSTATAH